MSAPKRIYNRGVTDLSKPAEEIAVGDVDSMSRLAVIMRLPTCGRGHPGGTLLCTRAAGHDEGDRVRSFASQHVAADRQTFVAQEVWGS